MGWGMRDCAVVAAEVSLGAIINDRVQRFLELTDPDEAGRDGGTLDVIFQRMAGGEGLPDICNGWDVPYGKVLMWLMGDAKRYEVYRRALEVSAHGLVGEALGIADEAPGVLDNGATDTGAISHAKLRIETRFRLAKYHAPEVYADKKQSELDVVQITDAGLVMSMGELLTKIGHAAMQKQVTVIDVTPDSNQGIE